MPILGYVEAGQATASVQGDLSVWMRGHKNSSPPPEQRVRSCTCSMIRSTKKKQRSTPVGKSGAGMWAMSAWMLMSGSAISARRPDTTYHMPHTLIILNNHSYRQNRQRQMNY